MTAPPTQLRIAFYGDDFTGSTDALESLTRAGLRTMLFIEPPTAAQLARHPGLQALGVAGLTRSMPPAAMEAALRPALERLKSLGAPFVHYKVCSTFDSSPAIGSIGCVLELGREIFASAPFVPILAGAPGLGRYCAFGNLFARSGADSEPFRLDRHPSMSRHPITPMDEADLRLHLAKQTDLPVGLFDLPRLGLAPDAARAELDRILRDEHPAAILFDVIDDSQLAAIGRLLEPYAAPASPLFAIGSSGVGHALGAHWAESGRVSPRAGFAASGPTSPLLVVSGSASPVTGGQIAWAAANGFIEIPLDTAALAAAEDNSTAVFNATERALVALRNGRNAIVHTSRGPADERLPATEAALRARGLDALDAKTYGARVFGAALGRIAREAVAECGLTRLGIAGGDTSGYVARALGIEAVEMIAPLAPGAPLCRATAPGSPADGLEVNFKGGQVGTPDYFAALQKGI